MHTATFTHRCVYTQTLLLTDSFTHRSFYSQMLVHANAFTHTHMRPFTPGPRKLEQMHCHTKKLSHPDPVTYRPCYTVDAVRRPSWSVHFKNKNLHERKSQNQTTACHQVRSCPHRKTMPRFYFGPMVVPPNLQVSTQPLKKARYPLAYCQHHFEAEAGSHAELRGQGSRKT